MIFECESEIHPNLPNISVILDHDLLICCHNKEFRSKKRAATTIGWARWLGEGENQVFPTHFPVRYPIVGVLKYIITAVFYCLLAATHQITTIEG